MPKVPSQTVKARSRLLTTLVDSFTDAHCGEVGRVQRVHVDDVAAKGDKLVAHNKAHTQMGGEGRQRKGGGKESALRVTVAGTQAGCARRCCWPTSLVCLAQWWTCA